MKLVAFRLNDEVPFRRLVISAVWLCALLIAAHPVSSDGLWWELSKGRASANGSWNPTADLIAGVFGADAHWLSGTLPYLLLTLFGLSGLMWLKSGSILVLTGLLLARASRPGSIRSWSLAGVTLATALLAARQAWEPVPLLFDTLGLVSMYLAAEQIAMKRSIAQVAFVLVLIALWANLGPRCIVGIVVVLSNLYCQPQKLVVGLGFAALMLGGCCLSPASWHTLFDSLTITVPQTAESSEILKMAGWHPWWERPIASESIAFVVLSAAYLLSVRQHPSVRSLFVLIAAHALAGASSENLPLAAVWMALVMTSAAVIVSPNLLERSGQTASIARSDKPRTSRRNAATGEFRPEQPAWQKLTCAVAMLFVGYAAVRPWDACGCGLGWGIDPRLHSEAFSASLADASLEGNAHCVGLREAGLLCWHAPHGVRPFDTPATALLSRRLREHVLATSDLSKSWQTPHRRPDGSWGGWWQILRARGTTALVVPSENLELIASLEPTIWKPLSLNAVSLVYGKAGDPGCARQIVNTLSVRQFVDRGVWTYQLSSEDSASTVEPLAWFGETSATYQSLRLARVFRAMQMHVGALKILHAIPVRTPNAVRNEFYANQMSLGYQERIQCGRSSELRLLSILLSASRSPTRSEAQSILNWPVLPDMPRDGKFSQALLSYAKGDLKMALDGLPDDGAEAIYAKALLLLESGDSRMAQSRLQELLTKFSDHGLSAMARTLAASLVF